MILSIDVLSQVDPNLNGLTWRVGLRFEVAMVLSIFADALVYQRLRAMQTIQAVVTERKRLADLYIVFAAYPALIFCLVLPLDWSPSGRTAVACVAGVAGVTLTVSHALRAWPSKIGAAIMGLLFFSYDPHGCLSDFSRSSRLPIISCCRNHGNPTAADAFGAMLQLRQRIAGHSETP